MRTEGRRTSDNVEDRRGMSTGKMAVGGGIGTIVIVLLVLLLGGDPSQVVNTAQQEATAESGPVATTPE
jgi:predicted metalloprotease